MKDSLFSDLCSEVKACSNCARMKDSARVLSGAVGSLDAPIMFIGEAPGRLGADESGIPFHGDTAGNNFENFLNQVNLSRYDAYITNSVLCNPKDEKGNNSTPTLLETANCSSYLRRQIDLVNPAIVVTLGGLALKALKSIEAHEFELNASVRKSLQWYSRKLIPLYHPGQRALIHRSFHNQLADYQFVAEQFRRLNRPQRKNPIGNIKENVLAVADLILTLMPKISYFALHKIFYLAECESVRQTGDRMTDSYFIRQKDGPYCTDLHIQRIKKGLSNLHITNQQNQLILTRNVPDMFDVNLMDRVNNLSEKISSIIIRVVEKYGERNNEELKRFAYLTTPMRNILRMEKRGVNLFNSPIDFSVLAHVGNAETIAA